MKLLAEPVIRVEELRKQYRIGPRAANLTLRESLVEAFRWPASRLGRRASPKRETFWALDGTTFDVHRGEVVGIIGRNGAGKSTLLKILSRITEPTSGAAVLHGRVGSLLEVGTGFHPELTGRENIFLNGAILGMKRAEIRSKFDEMVNFAEIGRFIDTPVKHYSSGMYVRLAFAVAAHLEPEILIVDEVLAVGDAAFQKKCLGKIGDVAKSGRTVLFVSHNMAAVLNLCDRVVLLEAGRIRAAGRPECVVADYLRSGAAQAQIQWNSAEAPGDDTIRIRSARILDAAGQVSDLVNVRTGFAVQIEYEIQQRVRGLEVGFRLATSDGTEVLTAGDTDEHNGADIVREPGYYTARCIMPGRLLSPGSYSISLGAHVPGIRTCYLVETALTVTIAQTLRFGAAADDRRRGVICPPLQWNTDRVEACAAG